MSHGPRRSVPIEMRCYPELEANNPGATAAHEAWARWAAHPAHWQSPERQALWTEYACRYAIT